jgi:hypothetical protein
VGQYIDEIEHFLMAHRAIPGNRAHELRGLLITPERLAPAHTLVMSRI